jgi:hypothetical protein
LLARLVMLEVKGINAGTIWVASLPTGRITRRIRAGKGQLTSVAFSPIGELIYFGGGGYIWSVDPAGRIERVAVGDSVAAGRDFLAVRLRENGMQHLYRVPLDGGASVEVQHEEPLHKSKYLAELDYTGWTDLEFGCPYRFLVFPASDDGKVRAVGADLDRLPR